MYKLSIIVPAYNEELNLSKVIEGILFFVKSLSYSVEIIVVDDCSGDGTFSIATQYSKKYENIKVVRHDENKGFGASFVSGVKYASGEYVTHIPGDGECNIEDVFLGISILSQVDLVVPYVVNSTERSISRRLISRLFKMIINFFFSTTLKYTNGPTVFNTLVIKSLEIKSKGFFFQAEILLRLIKSGYLYAEFPIFVLQRNSGVSSAFKLKSIIAVLNDFVKTFIGIHISKKYLIKVIDKSASYKRFNKIKINF